MFEILVDLYVFVAQSKLQPNLLGLVNVGDTQHDTPPNSLIDSSASPKVKTSEG
jgi:hypothetical protein